MHIILHYTLSPEHQRKGCYPQSSPLHYWGCASPSLELLAVSHLSPPPPCPSTPVSQLPFIPQLLKSPLIRDTFYKTQDRPYASTALSHD